MIQFNFSKCFKLISLYLTFTARPLLINDSGLNDGTAPHIIISVNSLCQDDEYTIYVQFGRRASDNSCVVQQNVTIMNGGKVNVPSDVTNGGGQYCYTAVLSNVAGNTTPTTRMCVCSSRVC